MQFVLTNKLTPTELPMITSFGSSDFCIFLLVFLVPLSNQRKISPTDSLPTLLILEISKMLNRSVWQADTRYHKDTTMTHSSGNASASNPIK